MGLNIFKKFNVFSNGTTSEKETDIDSNELQFKREENKLKSSILKFKMDLLRKMPFYGDVLMNVTFIPDSSIETACTNGLIIRFNPDFFRSIAEGQRNFVIMHEVFHLLLKHCRRRKDKNLKIWNVACDFVVNGMLLRLSDDMKNAGVEFEKVDDGLYLDYYSNESAEELYSRILADNKNSLDGKKESVVVRKNYKWSSETYEVNPVMDVIIQENDKENKALDEMADIIIKSLEEKIDDLTGRLVREASIRSRGNEGDYYIPDQFWNITETIRLPWRKLLAEYLEDEVSDEVSYATPERKYLHMDLIVPGVGRTEESLGDVWAFVDSSGSIGQEDLNQFLTQLHRLTKDFVCEMNVAFWDTEVSDVYTRIRTQKQILECVPHHSGGTDINCIYRYIENNRIKPTVILILTDGYFGKRNPEYNTKKNREKTILVLTRNSREDDEFKRIGKLASL